MVFGRTITERVIMSQVIQVLFAFLFALLPGCPTEDSTNCKWDAVNMGNGNGYDFVTIHDTYTNKVVVIKGEWHGVDARGRTHRDFPRAKVYTY